MAAQPGVLSIFSQLQVDELARHLDPKLISDRVQGGKKLSYLEGYEAINQANRIFGYGNWDMDVDDVGQVKCDSGDVYYTARVTIRVRGLEGRAETKHTDVGGAVANASKGSPPGSQAHETAHKGAVTDAMKRAMRHFGGQFANDLYNKDYFADLADEKAAEAQAKAQAANRLKLMASRLAAFEATRVDKGEEVATRRRAFETMTKAVPLGALTEWPEEDMLAYGGWLKTLEEKKAGASAA